MTLAIRNLLITIINTVVTIIALILTLRIIFLLIGANSSTPFVSWIYSLSNFLIAPFAGLLPRSSTTAGATIDFTGILALIIYALIAYILISIINALTNSVVEGTHEEDRLRHEPHYHH